jgi:hypothetical protein
VQGALFRHDYEAAIIPGFSPSEGTEQTNSADAVLGGNRQDRMAPGGAQIIERHGCLCCRFVSAACRHCS